MAVTDNPGDTLEFLALMNAAPGQQNNPASASQAAPSSLPDISGSLAGDSNSGMPQGTSRPTYGAAAPDGVNAPMQNMPAGNQGNLMNVSMTPAYEEPKPVVIKGGPRRVVRADGRQPDISVPLGQRRFALSSGHSMFTMSKKKNVLVMGVIALAIFLIVAICLGIALKVSNDNAVDHMRENLVGTTSYDAGLSKTPSNDGGYYTVFFATSTPTDETQIGDLSRVVMVRTDRDVTSATPTRVYVPTNLYAAPKSYRPRARTLDQVLAEESVSRALKVIDAACGTRLYNVVICDEDLFATLDDVMAGRLPAGSVTKNDLFGKVRSNLEFEGIIDFCERVSRLGTPVELDVPTTDLNINGVIMAQGTPAAYAGALVTAHSASGIQYDAQGNYLGTQYDEWGNPILDDLGNPAGAIYDQNGNLYFDEFGRLQFFGQQYDQFGYPVGTLYDENGNARLDQFGNPYGTQYDAEGNIQYDWRGNMIIVAQ